MSRWWQECTWGTHRNDLADVEPVLEEIGGERVTVGMALTLLNDPSPRRRAEKEGWLEAGAPAGRVRAGG